MAKDRPGVFAMFGKVLGDHHISISGVLQHEGTGPDGSVPVVIVTHETQEKNMVRALQALEALDVISGASVCIRIVDIPEDKEG
jgi:homoserine dehydrogenase